jgi:hypothetical protein
MRIQSRGLFIGARPPGKESGPAEWDGSEAVKGSKTKEMPMYIAQELLFERGAT